MSHILYSLSLSLSDILPPSLMVWTHFVLSLLLLGLLFAVVIIAVIVAVDDMKRTLERTFEKDYEALGRQKEKQLADILQ